MWGRGPMYVRFSLTRSSSIMYRRIALVALEIESHACVMRALCVIMCVRYACVMCHHLRAFASPSRNKHIRKCTTHNTQHTTHTTHLLLGSHLCRMPAAATLACCLETIYIYIYTDIHIYNKNLRYVAIFAQVEEDRPSPKVEAEDRHRRRRRRGQWPTLCRLMTTSRQQVHKTQRSCTKLLKLELPLLELDSRCSTQVRSRSSLSGGSLIR